MKVNDNAWKNRESTAKFKVDDKQNFAILR